MFSYREYYQKNKEKIKEYDKTYRLNNVEKIKNRKQKYYITNREHILQRTKQYSVKHLDEGRIRSKKWKENNPEKVKEKYNRYCKKHPEKVKEACKKWKSKNPEYDKQWRKLNPEKAHIIAIKRYHKRKRNLGFNALNNYSKGLVAHHINKNDVIYIPENIHRNICHCLETGKNMNEINKIAINYILEEGK